MFHVERKETPHILARPKDHLVSGLTFEVHLDQEKQIAKTQPFPAEEELPNFYLSDEYISHGNKRNTFYARIYRWVQTFMFSKKERWISKHIKGNIAYLDFGCGTGDFVHYLQEKGWKSYGIEPSEKARNFNPQHKNLFATLEELQNKNFDAIGMWHVLEHLPNPKQQIQTLEKQLSPNGVFVLALPNYKSLDAKHYKDHWAAYDVPRHLWHFSATGITALMKELGFALVQRKGLFFDAFYVSYLSEKQQQHSSSFIRGMFWGLISNLAAFITGEYSSVVYVYKKRN